MSKAQWKDGTSYSRGDKDRTPKAWDLELSHARLTVHRYLNCVGWFLSSPGLGISTRPLREADLEAAKAEALRYVLTLLEQMGDEVLAAQGV